MVLMRMYLSTSGEEAWEEKHLKLMGARLAKPEMKGNVNERKEK
jgi:hypothetical protein